jgi:phospho-N-acetylmuramoyl-pentapeptide-transferase
VLYYLLKSLYDLYALPGLGVVRYVTFRTGAAAVTALLITIYLGPKIIAYLQRRVIEPIKEDAPEGHRKKVGIPTMGGTIIISAITISVVLWADIRNPYVWLAVVSLLWMGAIGFIDDYRKVVMKVKGGLEGRYKLVGQIALGVFIAFYTYYNPQFASEATRAKTTVPFIKNVTLDYGIWYLPIAIFMIAAVSNAVNLTDGLDGLAAGCTAISALSLAGLSYVTGNIKAAKYLNIIYLEGSSEITIFCLAMAAAALGFLWFNSHPAQIFMGDTGSLALGSAIAVVALLIKKELLLPLIAGIFLIETVSVIIQKIYFKYTKRRYGQGQRVFLMAPIHHHFQKKGWAEEKIVIRFWIVAILLTLLTLITLKLR